jgi:hypothetical protein
LPLGFCSFFSPFLSSRKFLFVFCHIRICWFCPGVGYTIKALTCWCCLYSLVSILRSYICKFFGIPCLPHLAISHYHEK